MYIYIYNTSILGAVPVFDTVQVSTYTIVHILHYITLYYIVLHYIAILCYIIL